MALLQNKLYTLLSLVCTELQDKITVRILLNGAHPLFEGHFPGNPILPGVCTIQIIRELLEEGLKKEFTLLKAGNIKYIGFINPLTMTELRFDIQLKDLETGTLGCAATVSAEGAILCSFKGEYKAV